MTGWLSILAVAPSPASWDAFIAVPAAANWAMLAGAALLFVIAVWGSRRRPIQGSCRRQRFARRRFDPNCGRPLRRIDAFDLAKSPRGD